MKFWSKVITIAWKDALSEMRTKETISAVLVFTLLVIVIFNFAFGANQEVMTVVAPGIAEALFATALGLVAAIPAVVAYNKFSSDIGRYGNRLEIFATEFSAILSHQLEERG